MISQVWARYPDGVGDFSYSDKPTAGQKNVAGSAMSMAGRLADLHAQSTQGDAFFGTDPNGALRADFEHVVEFHLTLSVDDAAFTWANSSFEQYVDVRTFTYTMGGVSTTLPSPMKLRPRGFSTLSFAECMASKALPFLLDFANKNKSQTLFGVGQGYLRNSVLGPDHGIREWTVHRLLAQFGLPYLRTR